MTGVISSRGKSREYLQSSPDFNSQRLPIPANSGSTKRDTAERECHTTPAPPRNISQQYNRICKTHKKLVKTGAVHCSFSLSDTPPKVNIPSAPSSPVPLGQLEASVHFGVVGDFSGVQTPLEQSPITSPQRQSVIKSAPPALVPREVPFIRQPTTPLTSRPGS